MNLLLSTKGHVPSINQKIKEALPARIMFTRLHISEAMKQIKARAFSVSTSNPEREIESHEICVR